MRTVTATQAWEAVATVQKYLSEELETFCGLQTRNADLLAMLSKLEWCGLNFGQFDSTCACPICRCDIGTPHKPDCELAKLLT